MVAGEAEAADEEADAADGADWADCFGVVSTTARGAGLAGDSGAEFAESGADFAESGVVVSVETAAGAGGVIAASFVSSDGADWRDATASMMAGIATITTPKTAAFRTLPLLNRGPACRSGARETGDEPREHPQGADQNQPQH